MWKLQGFLNGILVHYTLEAAMKRRRRNERRRIMPFAKWLYRFHLVYAHAKQLRMLRHKHRTLQARASIAHAQYRVKTSLETWIQRCPFCLTARAYLNSWFATTWQGGHVGGQNKRIFPRRIYMKIEFSSQRREVLLFLTTNMAAVTSRANQQYAKIRTVLQSDVPTTSLKFYLVGHF